MANELLDAGYIELSKVCQPRFSFSLESRDATKQYEFKDQMRLLELGKIITIEKEEGLWYYPALLEISLNLDNSEEFSMTFANAMRLDDWGYTYADLISDASSTSRKVSANWQDILAYSKERAEISSLIKDPLDTTLRASFANMVNQEFTVDKNGILGRKKVSETSDEFEDEQVRLINNLLIFTDDNWETAKTALGKIYYTDEDGNQVTSYGLIAETIIGSLIMGERLKIKNTNSTVELGAEGITIKKADGTVVFSAKPDGSLVVRNYASQSSVDSLEGRMDDAEASIEVQAGQIALKASQSSVNALTNRVSSAETSITANANAIKLKASQSSVDSLEGRMDDAESEISQNASDISAKVSQTYGSSSSSFGWSLKSSGFYVYSNASTVMKITSSGLEVNGKITASSGSFTGRLTFGNNSSYYIDANYNDSSYYINLPGLKVDDASGAVFSGKLSAASGTFSGELSAATGSFSGTLSAATGRLGDGVIIGSRGTCTLSGYETSGSSTVGMKLSYGESAYLTLYGDRGGQCSKLYAYNYLYLESLNGKLQGTWSSDSAVTVTSDANAKNSICELALNYDSMYDYLRPVAFKYNNGTSGRLHVGFIAQDVYRAIIDAGLSTDEFAGFVEYSVNEQGDDRMLGLRYDEFISLNTWQIQKLKARVAELEAIVAKLQEG